jgi:hypothetical protein
MQEKVLLEILDEIKHTLEVHNLSFDNIENRIKGLEQKVIEQNRINAVSGQSWPI